MSDDKINPSDFEWMDEEEKKARQYFEKRDIENIEEKNEKVREKLLSEITIDEINKFKSTDKFKNYTVESLYDLLTRFGKNIKQLKSISIKYGFVDWFDKLDEKYTWEKTMSMANEGAIIGILIRMNIYYVRLSEYLKTENIDIPELY